MIINKPQYNKTDPYFLAGQKGVSTTMVEINIAVRTNDESKLRQLLDHIAKEITDLDYRIAEIEDSTHKVDLNWVYMDEGRYNWSRNDRI